MKVTNEEKNEKIAIKAKGILGSKPLIAICAVIIAGNLAYPSISKLVTAKEESLHDYCKELDDEVFVEACELYSKYGSLKELETNEAPEDVEIFKDCVKEATKNKIKKLKRYL